MDVLLLHGQPGSAADWRAVLDALEQRGVGALTLDRPGWGRSPAAPGGLQANAAAALRILDEAEIDAATIVGHSFGGAVAAWLAAHHPDRVDGLVLVAPAANRAALYPLDRFLALPIAGYLTSASMMAGAGAALALRPARRLLASPLGLDDRFLADYGRTLRSPARWSAFAREQRALIDELPALEADLPRITAPTTIVIGDQDRIVPPGSARRLKNQIPGAELVVLGGAGHLIPQQQTAELVDLIAVTWIRPTCNAPA
jgi:pimeloyl-ACP methyl ester carboxylesterase